MIRSVVVLAFALVVCHQAQAQQWPVAGRGEVHTEIPNYRGTAANAPIPVEMHMKNEGGSDGAGLCVISSLMINGRYQGVPNLEQIWKTAKARPGGYSPGKLEDLLNTTVPDEKWASYVGTDPTVLHRLSKNGYAIGATMNTGELYGYRRIHHMISLNHFDHEKDIACVIDNNQPGVYSWMSSKEYLRRWVDGGTGWAFVWLRKLPFKTEPMIMLLVGAAAFLFLMTRPRPRPALTAAFPPMNHWGSTDAEED